MLFLSAIIVIALVKNILGAKDSGQYIVLDNITPKAYLCIEEDNCNKVYICRQCEERFFDDKLFDCYNRNEHTDMSFIPTNRDNPNECNIKGYVNIKSDKCYFTSNQSDKVSYDKPIELNRVRYYDRDVYQDPNSKTNVEMALTEYGWCRVARDDNDPKWMNDIDDDVQINQINIPGTHDSGTYAIGDTGIDLNLRTTYGRTQEETRNEETP